MKEKFYRRPDGKIVLKAFPSIGIDRAYVPDAPDLSKCPKCGGPADNGHDRCMPPSPYNCTKCG